MDTLNTISAPHKLVLFRGETNTKQVRSESQDLPVPLEMISLFEAISGWVVEFQKSSKVKRRDTLGQNGQVSTKGEFAIVDMSAEWPANRPTASRIKCEQFLKLLSEYVRRSQVQEDELNRLQQYLAAQSGSDTDLIQDSFAPRHPYRTQSETHSDFILSPELNSLTDISTESSNRQDKTEPADRSGTVEDFSAVPQWQIGGRRGIHENRYIDWVIRNDHRIELLIGQIEFPDNADSQLTQEWETKLTISPETSRFWFSVERRGCFWIFDQATSRLNRISEFAKISQLNPQQALVLTTANLEISESVGLSLDNQATLFQNADDLASAIQDCLQTEEPLLVLLRH